MQMAVKVTLAGVLLAALIALPTLLPAGKRNPAEAGIIVTLDPDAVQPGAEPLLDMDVLEDEPGVAQKSGEIHKEPIPQQASPEAPKPAQQSVLRDEPVGVDPAPPEAMIPSEDAKAWAAKTSKTLPEEPEIKPEPTATTSNSRSLIRTPLTVSPAVSTPIRGMISNPTSPAVSYSEASQPVEVHPQVSIPMEAKAQVMISQSQPAYAAVPMVDLYQTHEIVPVAAISPAVLNSQPAEAIIDYSTSAAYPTYPVAVEEDVSAAVAEGAPQEIVLTDAPPLDIGSSEIEVSASSNPAHVITSVARAEVVPAPPQPPPPTASGWQAGLNISLEVIAFHERFEYNETAYNNPGNRVYGFPGSRNAVEIEPKVKYVVGNFELEVAPRLTWEQVRIIIDDDLVFKDTVTDFEVPYARASYQAGPFWVQAGRYEKVWGPSIFVAPSNPFEGDRDFVEAHYVIPGSNWSASLIYNFDDGLEDDGEAPMILTKAGWHTQTASFTATTQGGEDWYGIGGYGQWSPIPDALLYADGLLSYGPRNLPDPSHSGLHDLDEKEWEARILAGAAYRFDPKTTLAVEYMHNTQGYSDDEANQVFDLQRRAFSSAANGTSRGDIVRLMDIDFFDFGRHYLMGSLRRNDVFDNVDVGLRYAHNLGDGSGRLTGNVDWYLSDTAKLFAEGEFFHGDIESEFGRFADYQLTLGLRWRPEPGLF